MIDVNQNGSETKAVVKLCFSGEFVRLSVPVKHLQVYPAGSTVGRGECSSRCQEAGRSLSRITVPRKEVA